MKRYTNEHAKQLNRQITEKFPHIYPITDDMKISYDGIARMVMLDRYSNKDDSLITLEEGDLVVVKVKSDPKYPTLATAFVTKIEKDYITVKVEDEYLAQIDPLLNPNNGIVRLMRSWVSKPLEIYYEQISKRVATHLAEDEVNKEQWTQKFEKELTERNLIPAGRVLYGAGSAYNVTYFNCFVLPMPKDSRQGLSAHRAQAIEIMSRGGGVGTNGSTLRPKDAPAIGVGGRSSGAVSWLNDLSLLTNLIQQGGSRRGAQMIMLQDWHPDILEFIISKMQNPNILRWIVKNFKNPIIKKLAEEKLKFVPISEFETQVLNEVIASSKDTTLVKKAKEKIADGGKYEVVNPEFLTGANISVGITKNFMDAVESNSKYSLKFPDIAKLTKVQKEVYDNQWHEIGDVRIWEEMGYPTKTYYEIEARELWDLINFCATYSAEPGVFFIDTANDMTNAKAYGQKVVCTNPCGEQPLAPYSVCNLAAINLSNFVDHKSGEVLWTKLDETVANAVRMQDNIIDKTPYFLEENKTQAKGERRVGLGVMGLHDLLIWNKKAYGSQESLDLIDKLFERIATIAYKTSALLATEKGSFGFLTNKEALLETGYIKKLPEDVREEIRKHGLRNSHLLTIAPTGSTGTMAGVSTGLEPYFAFKYFRSGRLGKFMEVDQAIVEEWKQINNWDDAKALPEYFVSAMSISPEAHVDTQTTIQRWIDSSISKTVNAPRGYTVKQVEQVYSRLYKNGAKGGTIYVDGSRETQVLSITNKDEEFSNEIPEEKEALIKEDEKPHTAMYDTSKKVGQNIGDICPVCKKGEIADLGGCHSCTNCGAQVLCGL